MDGVGEEFRVVPVIGVDRHRQLPVTEGVHARQPHLPGKRGGHAQTREGELLRKRSEEREEHVFRLTSLPKPSSFFGELRKQLSAGGNAAQAETTVAAERRNCMPMKTRLVRHAQLVFKTHRPGSTDVIEPACLPTSQIVSHHIHIVLYHQYVLVLGKRGIKLVSEQKATVVLL